MGWVTGIVVYFLVWWVTLFAVLPLWVTTVVSAVIWLAIFALVRSPWLSFREP